MIFPRIPKKRAVKILSLILLSFFLYLISYFLLDIRWLVFFILIPFFAALHKADTFFEHITISFLTGFAFQSACLLWIINVTPVFLIFAALWQSLFWILFGVGFFFLRGKRTARFAYITVPAAWVCLEFLRSWGFLGMPVGLMGYVIPADWPLAQVASVTGIYGLSFLVIFVNHFVYKVISKKKTALGLFRNVLFLAGLFLMLTVFGRCQLRKPWISEIHYVTIVQPNIPARQKKDIAQWPGTFKSYQKITLEAFDSRESELVIWPETAVSFFLFHPQRQNIRDGVCDFSDELKTPLLLGAQDYKNIKGRFYAHNIAALLSREGRAVQTYAKMKLIPIMEYMPLKPFIPLVRKLGGIGVYRPGDQYTVFDAGSFKFSSVICFESLFPSLVRQFVKRGPEFMVNITNDEPSLGLLGKYYSLNAEMLRWRAIETRRSFVRVANNGISMVVDPVGRVTGKIPVFTAGSETVSVGVCNQKSLYVLFGEWFVALCFVVAAFGLERGIRYPPGVLWQFKIRR